MTARITAKLCKQRARWPQSPYNHFERLRSKSDYLPHAGSTTYSLGPIHKSPYS